MFILNFSYPARHIKRLFLIPVLAVDLFDLFFSPVAASPGIYCTLQKSLNISEWRSRHFHIKHIKLPWACLCWRFFFHGLPASWSSLLVFRSTSYICTPPGQMMLWFVRRLWNPKQKGTANGASTRRRFGSKRDLVSRDDCGTWGCECLCSGSCSRNWEPAYPEKNHMNQNERKEGPMAAFQCISKRVLVARELGNQLWETGGENM